MGRMTRAKAAEVAQRLHIDGNAALGLEDGGIEGEAVLEELGMNRSPLTEIAGNRPGSGSGVDAGEGSFDGLGGKSSGRKSVRWSGKGVGQPLDMEEEIDVSEASSSPSMRTKTAFATSTATESPTKSDGVSTPSKDSKSQAGRDDASSSSLTLQHANAAPASTVEMSRAQSNGGYIIPTSPSDVDISTIIETGETPVSKTQDNMPGTLLRSNSPIPAPSTSEQQSEMSKSQYDALEAAVIEASNPPSDRLASAPPPLDSISALNDLDEAVEKVNDEVPEVRASPLKTTKVRKEKPAPAVRATKASQARLSLAHGPKDAIMKAPALGRPRQSISGPVEGRRLTSLSSLKSGYGVGGVEEKPLPAKKEITIPHSKPRPMSMSFPAPRPPPKSKKPLTTSNFVLPGEAMSAKFRAAREEKARKEAEEAKGRIFKARPAPNMTKAPAAVRQTSTSKARESLMAAGGKIPATAATAHVRANSVATSRPAVTTLKQKSTSTTMTAPGPKKSTVPSAKTVTIPKRASTSMSQASKTTTFSRPGTNLGQHHRAPSAGTTKGKEVFNRTAYAKGDAEREKKEREEAAKKARVEAAERSRVLSREWAEKQKIKKSGLGGRKSVLLV